MPFEYLDTPTKKSSFKYEDEDNKKSSFQYIDTPSGQDAWGEITKKIGKNVLGVGTAAMDMVGGIPGAVAGALAGTATAVGHADPQGGLELAKNVMHTATPSVALDIDTSDNKGYEYAMKPVEWLTKGIEMAGKGYGDIAGLMGAGDTTQKNIAASTELGLLLAGAKPGAKAVKA